MFHDLEHLSEEKSVHDRMRDGALLHFEGLDRHGEAVAEDGWNIVVRTRAAGG